MKYSVFICMIMAMASDTNWRLVSASSGLPYGTVGAYDANANTNTNTNANANTQRARTTSNNVAYSVSTSQGLPETHLYSSPATPTTATAAAAENSRRNNGVYGYPFYNYYYNHYDPINTYIPPNYQYYPVGHYPDNLYYNHYNNYPYYYYK